MSDFDYAKALSDISEELETLQAARTNLEAKLVEVNAKIAALTKSYNAIAPLVGKFPIPDISDVLLPPGAEALKAAGITVAVRAILEREPHEDFTAAKVRSRLTQQGWDCQKYTNPLATIQAVLSRLVASNHAKEGLTSDSRKYFYSAYRIPRPPEVSDLDRKDSK